MMAATELKLNLTPDLVTCPYDIDDRRELESELERNGQTYFDKEEDVDEQTELVTRYDNRNMTSDKKEVNLSLCRFHWYQIKWANVVWLFCLHTAFVWAYVHVLLWPVKMQSTIWTVLSSIFSGFGMSVGAHRFWAHRSFKATSLLRFYLLILQTMTINGSAFSYARDHRNHHKWPATDADPKNPARGFFFAHIGWWMLCKRPEVVLFGRKVPIDDLHEDKMLMLQHRFYLPLVVLLAFVVPVLVPMLGWHEDLATSLALCIIRIVVVLHHLFTVNSVAHFWGYRPYNR